MTRPDHLTREGKQTLSELVGATLFRAMPHVSWHGKAERWHRKGVSETDEEGSPQKRSKIWKHKYEKQSPNGGHRFLHGSLKITSRSLGTGCRGGHIPPAGRRRRLGRDERGTKRKPGSGRPSSELRSALGPLLEALRGSRQALGGADDRAARECQRALLRRGSRCWSLGPGGRLGGRAR